MHQDREIRRVAYADGLTSGAGHAGHFWDGHIIRVGLGVARLAASFKKCFFLVGDV